VIKGGENDSLHDQVVNQETAEEAKGILETVVSGGTGTKAQIGAEGQWGKTGTTENNGDAWFCGGIEEEVTACVWVGYANSVTPMETLYEGGPVMGGTFPALIWGSVIRAWEELKATHAAERAAQKRGEGAEGGGTEFQPFESTGEYVPEEESFEVAPEGGGEGETEAPAAPAAPAEAAPEAAEGGGGGLSAG
jgi:penicillin-binding protein 1A